MESQEKSSQLFYLIIALIVLGFIASFAFPINAQERKLTDTSRFAGHFVQPPIIPDQQPKLQQPDPRGSETAGAHHT